MGKELGALRRIAGIELHAIAAAQSRAQEQRARIESALAARPEPLIPADTCLVVFGSLAREEWTIGSDIDWALLVDGPADHAHAMVSSELGRFVAGLGKTPEPTGVFAGTAFSHQLVHWIGGEQDTNVNTTRRILLLLESISIPLASPVRDRVVRAVLDRYVHDDQAFYVGRERNPSCHGSCSTTSSGTGGPWPSISS